MENKLKELLELLEILNGSKDEHKVKEQEVNQFRVGCAKSFVATLIENIEVEKDNV